MPREATDLQNARVPIPRCPECGVRPFEPFMRGMVQRGLFGQLFAWLRREEDWRRYCALICWSCKKIVGYE